MILMLFRTATITQKSVNYSRVIYTGVKSKQVIHDIVVVMPHYTQERVLGKC